MNIRDLKARYSNLQNYKIKDTKEVPALENLCCEVYNPGTEKNWNPKEETAIFTSRHPNRHNHYFFGLPPIEWFRIECKPYEWVFLPHGDYIVSFPSGNQSYRMIINVGDAMFKGNKLPSRPDKPKIQSFV